jgi:hypothetical protein
LAQWSRISPSETATSMSAARRCWATRCPTPAPSTPRCSKRCLRSRALYFCGIRAPAHVGLFYLYIRSLLPITGASPSTARVVLCMPSREDVARKTGCAMRKTAEREPPYATSYATSLHTEHSRKGARARVSARESEHESDRAREREKFYNI